MGELCVSIPRCNHCTLNFCCHVTSSWRSISSHQVFGLLSNSSNLGVTSCTNLFWTPSSLFLNRSFRLLTFPNTYLFHFLCSQLNSLMASCSSIPLLQFVSVTPQTGNVKVKPPQSRKVFLQVILPCLTVYKGEEDNGLNKHGAMRDTCIWVFSSHHPIELYQAWPISFTKHHYYGSM